MPAALYFAIKISAVEAVGSGLGWVGSIVPQVFPAMYTFPSESTAVPVAPSNLVLPNWTVALPVPGFVPGFVPFPPPPPGNRRLEEDPSLPPHPGRRNRQRITAAMYQLVRLKSDSIGGPPVKSVVGERGVLEPNPEVDICQESVEANGRVIRLRPNVPTSEADIIILCEEPIEAGACMIAEGVVLFGKRGCGGGLLDAVVIITAPALHIRYERSCGNHQRGVQDQVSRIHILFRRDELDICRMARVEIADGGAEAEILRKVPHQGGFKVTSGGKVIEVGRLGEIASAFDADLIFSYPLGRSLSPVGCVGGADEIG